MKTTLLLFTAMAGLGLAQDTSAAAPPADAPKSYWGSMKYSGLIDVYGSRNFNKPASEANSFRNFDVKANQFDLNFSRFVVEHDAAPIGFRFDFAGGAATTRILHGTETAGQAFRYLQQAYVTAKPFGADGIQFDFGKFYTSAGAELTESHANWNYSRAFLYANGPYYHLGLRATAPITKTFTLGGQLVNGWNNVADNNGAKTVGVTTAWNLGKVSWNNNYYVGPEKSTASAGVRHFYDTVILMSPTDKLSTYVNVDYGVDKDPANGNKVFYGVAVAGRYAFTKKLAFAPRVEYYKDRDGFITGTQQALKEFTLTGEYKMHDRIISRMEYRRDFSDAAVFDRHGLPSKNQSTLLVALMAFWESKR